MIIAKDLKVWVDRFRPSVVELTAEQVLALWERFPHGKREFPFWRERGFMADYGDQGHSVRMSTVVAVPIRLEAELIGIYESKLIFQTKVAAKTNGMPEGELVLRLLNDAWKGIHEDIVVIETDLEIASMPVEGGEMMYYLPTDVAWAPFGIIV